ncbi:MAG: tetraacyldisaccharide 4'-kinase [bacterium]|nr:tetraacyldisaccharide 4'-kinase [bacterium]
MRIVDLRHPAVRALTARWQARAGAAPSGAGRVLTAIVDRWQARQAARRPVAGGVPLVVSIGNLALGGTGKTPVTAQLALDLAAAGLRGAIVTRGYGSPLPGPVAVSAATPGAGDEARLLAGLLDGSGWRVVQSRRRALGVAWLAAQAATPDIIVLEDGHQTAGVGRHLDVLILDDWRTSGERRALRLEPRTGAVAPFGHWRESARGADRAGVWLVEMESPLPAGPPGVAVAGFARTYRLQLPEPARTGAAVLLSGIARPAAFEAEAVRLLGRPAALAIRCRDHESYDGRCLVRIDKLLDAAGADLVVTTAKDQVKLAPLWGRRPPLAVLEMRVSWTGDKALPELVRERLDVVRRGTSPG